MGGVALAILILVSGGATSGLVLPDWGSAPAFVASQGLDGALTESALRAVGAAATRSPPPCVGDTCQPRVSIPGHEPRVDVRGKRTELFLSALERMNAGFVTTVARSVATAGIRLDYQPPRGQDANSRHPNAGRFVLIVRWRLDSWHGPVWQAARSP